MFHTIALNICSCVYCVLMFSLSLLVFEFLVVPIMSPTCQYSVVTIILVFCVVCAHVYTSIPGSRIPSGLSHDINMRDVTLALCVIVLSLSILALGFLAKRLMTLTRGISPLCSVPLYFHCQSCLHDPQRIFS